MTEESLLPHLILAGIVYILAMILLELILVYYFRRFAVIPVVLFFFGCVLTVRGIINRPKASKHNDIIDNFQ